jgi:hypothetical protein
MDEERLSPDRERQLLDLFEQAALNDFPNPNRIGCPGPVFLRTVATDRRSISIRDERLNHITRCSPCFQEFVNFRDSAAKRRKRTRAVATAGTIAALALGITLYEDRTRLLSVLHLSRPPSSSEYVTAHLDLKDWSIVRGVGEPPPSRGRPGTLRLPHRKLALTITLPFATDAGEYQIQVLGENGNSLASASGMANIHPDGTTVLEVRLDLSNVASGMYRIGIRRVPWDWTVHPVVIE